MMRQLAVWSTVGLMLAVPICMKIGELKAQSVDTSHIAPLYVPEDECPQSEETQTVSLPAAIVQEAEKPTEVPEPEPASAPQELRELMEPYHATAVKPTYARLGRRTPDGDWVTAHFDQPLVPRDETRVAVLGYHNFSNSKRPTEMLMRTAEFCQQMQYIRDAGLAVISMQDFLEWRQGKRLLPARCVLITIDDGWKSVYTDAYPVLRAYGYPFTLFLYTRYINVRGSSMTHAMIREMMRHGATIGSHSCNHLYPKDWKQWEADPEKYHAQVVREIYESGKKLRKLYGRCSTYCYPGGYRTPHMQAMLQRAGYSAAFTVLEAKVESDELDYEVHRYMVFGVDKEIFRRGVNFDGVPGVVPSREGIAAAEAPAKAFFPKAFEGIVEFESEEEQQAESKPDDQKKDPAPEAPQPTTAQLAPAAEPRPSSAAETPSK